MSMKRKIMGLFLVLMLAGCGGLGHMTKQDKPLDVKTVKPQPGKAAVLITRNTSFGGAIEFAAYLDRKMIGITRGKSCFYKDNIEPGQHYISAYSENLDTLLMNLEADKTYYLTHDPRMGFWKAAVSTGVTTLDVVVRENQEGCNHYIYDTKNPGEDLSEKEWETAQKNARKP